MDGVEFVMEIENQFGITIPDDDALHFRTLGQLHNYLLETCAGRRREGCPTRSASYRLRCGSTVVLGSERAALRPGTPLLSLLHGHGLRLVWARLERELPLKLPPLRDRTGEGVFWGMATAATAGFHIVRMITRDAFLSLGVAVFCLLPGTLFGYIVGLFWKPTVDSRYGTLGELARGVATLNAAKFQASQEPSTVNDPTWERLCAVVVQQASVPRAELSRRTRFVEDLGL